MPRTDLDMEASPVAMGLFTDAFSGKQSSRVCSTKLLGQVLRRGLGNNLPGKLPQLGLISVAWASTK